MPQYLVSIHRPNGFDYSAIDAAVRRDISAVNDEMVAAGVRVFVGGLQSTSLAKSIRREPDGALIESDGAYLDASAYVDGFWVLEVADLEAAMTWGRKAAAACRGSIEVRPFY